MGKRKWALQQWDGGAEGGRCSKGFQTLMGGEVGVFVEGLFSTPFVASMMMAIPHDDGHPPMMRGGGGETFSLGHMESIPLMLSSL